MGETWRPKSARRVSEGDGAWRPKSAKPVASGRQSGSFDLSDPVQNAPAEPAPAGPFGGGGFRSGDREQLRDGVMSQTGGASGGWGFPDPGFFSAMGTQFHKGAMKSGSDEAVGGLAALKGGHGPGAYLRLPDGTEVPVPTQEALYRGGRDFVRQQQEAASEHYPTLGFLAEMGGEALGDYAFAGPKALGRGYQTLAGLVRGLAGSDAELTPSNATPWTVGEAALSTMLGGAVGNQAPVLMSKAAQSGVGRYLGNKAEDALVAGGNKLKDIAGWLKVNSLHPTPTGSEAMAALPGGTAAVGRELMEQGLGGITKKQTAEQIEAASRKAGAAIGELAAYHDAVGAPPVDIRPALAAGRARAQELLDEPTTEAVGKQMMALVEKYESKFANGSGSAEQVLGMKRALGDAAYGEGEKLKRAGDKVAGKLGKGLSAFERATDDALDGALGPRFEAANLLSRRMRGATQAADRSAARAQGNGLIPIKPLLAMAGVGGAGAVGGMGTALPAAAAMWLGDKYGAQLGAKAAWGSGEAAPVHSSCGPVRDAARQPGARRTGGTRQSPRVVFG